MSGRFGTAEYRHELKYLVSDAELRMLEVRLRHLMRPDEHASQDGSYTIRSVYFDDPFDSAYYDNENGVSPRAKWRIRRYLPGGNALFLERKVKEASMTKKDACPLTLRQAKRMMEPDETDGAHDSDLTGEEAPLYRRFLMEQQTRHLRPKVIVSYERRPFIYAAGNVRVTFDYGITSSADYPRFFEEELHARPVMKTGQQILEVKYDAFLPDPVYHAVQMRHMLAETFSKYYLCRRYHL